MTTATAEPHRDPAAEAALPRRDRRRSCASSSATPTSCRSRALVKVVVNMGVGEAARDAQADRRRGARPDRDHRPEAARARGPQVDRAVQAARGHADRREGHAARRPDVGVPGPAAARSRCRVSVTSAGCRRSSSTATATTRSVSTSSRCSTRSTRTGSTGRAAWTSRWSPPPDRRGGARAAARASASRSRSR